MRTITSLVLVALTAACAVGPGYHRPSLGMPDGWRPSSASEDSLRPFYDSLRTSRDTLLPHGADTARVPFAYDTAPAGARGDTAAALKWLDLVQDSVHQVEPFQRRGRVAEMARPGAGFGAAPAGRHRPAGQPRRADGHRGDRRIPRAVPRDARRAPSRGHGQRPGGAQRAGVRHVRVVHLRRAPGHRRPELGARC